VQYTDIRNVSDAGSTNIKSVWMPDGPRWQNPGITGHSPQMKSLNSLNSLERPSSTLSAPVSNRHKVNQSNFSPGFKSLQRHIGTENLNKFSPKTPHSAPTATSSTVVHRKRAASSPRFRFHSSDSEDSHYNLPHDGSDEHIGPGPRLRPTDRRLAVSEHSLTDSSDNECDSSVDQTHRPAQNSKITYITAKDLQTPSSDDEEEAAPIDDDVEHRPEVTSQSCQNPRGPNGQASVSSDSTNNLCSPSDVEVETINFPSRQRNNHSTTPSKHLNDKNNVSYDPNGYIAPSGSSKISDGSNGHAHVPDIITSVNRPPEVASWEEDGVFMI